MKRLIATSIGGTLALATLVLVLYLVATVGRLQHSLIVSQYASAKTRVTTVTQRCVLTSLVDNVVVRLVPQYAPPFTESYNGCEKQLKLVKAIFAHSPKP